MYSGIFNQSRLGDWYVDMDMYWGMIQRAVFESLAAFYPGMQVLLGELMSLLRTANSFAKLRLSYQNGLTFYYGMRKLKALPIY